MFRVATVTNIMAICSSNAELRSVSKRRFGLISCFSFHLNRRFVNWLLTALNVLFDDTTIDPIKAKHSPMHGLSPLIRINVFVVPVEVGAHRRGGF